MLSQPRSFSLTPIADTNDRFCDFSPYVASINNDGIVAFQAALRTGGPAFSPPMLGRSPCLLTRPAAPAAASTAIPILTVTRH